jgi:aerobic-type carbon monoxide dehydrogenase small subunit (CoxS/CutS family)
MKREISFIVNAQPRTLEVESHMRLIDLIRDGLGLTGTKEGCGEGECGACTVIVDGKAVNSCLYPALELEGRTLITIEGLLEPENKPSVIQKAFIEQGGIQCGFCSPGMIMSTKALLDKNNDPCDEEIRTALLGNLCRCTGYIQIVDSVKAAAKMLKEGKS